ncbi:hypothetical protein [Dokdonella sp.]|uniref:hypothetical protein n=1 Tax=Dokdonella sp. TaxID=2291710 RepID=UPI002F428233
MAGTAAAAPAVQAGAGLDPRHLSKGQIDQMQSPAALLRAAALYKQGDDLDRLAWTLERLTAFEPNVGELKLALATTYARQGEKTKAYDLLLGMQRVGYGYDLAENADFAKISGTKVWTYITDGLKTNLKPFGEGKVAFSLPAGDHLYESLAWDPVRKQLLVGSVRDGTIMRADADGKLTDFIAAGADGLWSVYAMAVDADDDALYVASTASLYFKGFSQANYGQAGVFKFRLSNGKLLEKYLLPSGAQPNTLSSLAARKGLVFAADGLHNVIYRLDGGALKPMVANPKLTSVRGLALSDDGKTLYFADYALGIFGVDLAAGKPFDLKYDPAKLALGGIDGLSWYDHRLVAIQSGMSPRRVMRIALADDMKTVTAAMPLDAANPAFELPTYGAVAGDSLYFVANSQKNAYDSYGSPKDERKLEPVKVFRTDLRFAWDGGTLTSAKVAPASSVISDSKPGSGVFSNVDGGSQSVTGN